MKELSSPRVFAVLAAVVGALGLARADSPVKPPAAGSDPHFRFVDVSRQARLDRVVLSGRPEKDHLLDSSGTGIAFLDYDRDGRLDVYVVNGWRLDGARVAERGRNALYRGLPGGTFEDVTDAAGVGGEERWGSGVAVADFDRDGWPDLFVTTFGANLLYRNLGTGRFEDVAAKVGVDAPGWNTGAAFFDADGDGFLDLYVASYIDCTLADVLSAKRTLDWRGLEKVAVGPFGLKGAPDHFFRSVGGKRFVDATAEAGLEDRARGFGFAVRAADFDGDGRVDLYVANDSDPNYLYRNEGNGRFKEMATWSGSALDANGAAQASMGIGVGDATGDGLLDVFVTNFSEDFSTLYRGLGNLLFEDASRETGVGQPTYRPLSWGTAFADFDNDGDLDLVVANGHIYPQIDRHPELIGTFAQRNLLLENQGPGAATLFRDVTAEAGPGFEPVVVEPRPRGGGFRRRRTNRRPDQPPGRCSDPPSQRESRGRVAHRRLRRRPWRDEPDRDGRDRDRGRPQAAARHRLGRLVPEQSRPPAALWPREPGEGRRGGRPMARRDPLETARRTGPAVPEGPSGVLNRRKSTGEGSASARGEVGLPPHLRKVCSPGTS